MKLHIQEVLFFQCTIFSIILALALISGGIPSAINAADIKEDYIDPLEEFCNLDGLTARSEEICNNLQTIRDAQIASAVSSITQYISSNKLRGVK